MSYKYYWWIFLSLIFACIGAYTSYTLYLSWNYYSLNQTTTPTKIEWKVVASDDEHFYPYAKFFYQVQDKHYQHEEQWKQHYLNAWTANETISRLNETPLKVWYNKNTPQFSTLQKIFPYKYIFSTVFLWGLGIYFYTLGLSIQKP